MKSVDCILLVIRHDFYVPIIMIFFMIYRRKEYILNHRFAPSVEPPPLNQPAGNENEACKCARAIVENEWMGMGWRKWWWKNHVLHSSSLLSMFMEIYVFMNEEKDEGKKWEKRPRHCFPSPLFILLSQSSSSISSQASKLSDYGRRRTRTTNFRRTKKLLVDHAQQSMCFVFLPVLGHKLGIFGHKSFEKEEEEWMNANGANSFEWKKEER